jgi:hypothetical protein
MALASKIESREQLSSEKVLSSCEELRVADADRGAIGDPFSKKETLLHSNAPAP